MKTPPKIGSVQFTLDGMCCISKAQLVTSLLMPLDQSHFLNLCECHCSLEKLHSSLLFNRNCLKARK